MKTRIKMVKQIGAIAAGLALLFSFQNCADQTFSTVVEPVTATGGPNCREQLTKSTYPIQLIFVVDVSGSNADSGNTAGTDVGKAMRAGSISKFFDTYKSKTNFGWSVITFAGTKATTQIALSDSVMMQQMIDSFLAIPDNGNTPYAAALTASRNLITGDTTSTADTKYIVLFMSDGQPTDGNGTFVSEVEAVINAVPGSVPADERVTLNTLYYGPKNDNASGLLRSMASTGNGNFLDTNANPTGNSFLISDLVVIPGVICD